jgi:flagellar biogenesis protein FliO
MSLTNCRRSLSWFSAALAIALASAASLSIAEERFAPPSTNNVQQATHYEQAPARQPLSPQSPLAQKIASPTEGSKSSSRTGPLSAIFTVLGSLAIVLGIFVGIAWLLRRGMPGGSGRLPSGVVEVLGNAPLAARRQMHVLRFGDKILLVCVSQTGVDTLSEIEDAAEVERLTKLCQKSRPTASAGTFDQVFGKLMRSTPAEQTAASGGLAAMAIRKKSPVGEEVDT